jgi:peptidoglycan/LPS O-acetylase OafA/YrhL
MDVPAEPPERARRNAAIDGLRGIAALSVFAFHAWLYTLPEVRAAGGRDGSPLAAFAAELRIGLVLFFVLSGYLLFRPWVAARLGQGRRPRPATYALHRVGRIVPAYWLAIAGSVLLLWPLAGEPGVRLPPAEQLPLFFVFLQNRSADTVMTLDPPMWTLAVEAGFYALLPLLGWLAWRARATRAAQALVPLLALAVGLAWNRWLSDFELPPATLAKSLPAMLPYFAVGMLTAVLLHGRRLSGRAALLLAVAGLALVGADMWVHASAESGTPLAYRLRVIRDLPAALGFAAILALAVTRPPAALAARPLAWTGEVSFGLYLWHVPVLLWLRAQGLLPLDAVGATLVALPLSLLAGWASWRLVERPAIAWSRRTRRLGANPPVSPAAPRSAGTAPSRTRSSAPDAAPSPSGSPPRHARA